MGAESIAEFFGPYKGELAGLAAAACWALTSLIFSRVPAPAGAIALFKNSVSCGFLLLTLLLLSGEAAAFDFVYEADLATWLYLGGSALSGLVLGDTCYFRSLQILGPRRTLVVTTLVPPIGALCGWLLLSETLSWLAWGGIGLTVGGVIWVIRESLTRMNPRDISPAQPRPVSGSGCLPVPARLSPRPSPRVR